MPSHWYVIHECQKYNWSICAYLILSHLYVFRSNRSHLAISPMGSTLSCQDCEDFTCYIYVYPRGCDKNYLPTTSLVIVSHCNKQLWLTRFAGIWLSLTLDGHDINALVILNPYCVGTKLFQFNLVSWLLMPWLLVSPGHQYPWYWLCKICKFLSYMRKDFYYLCHFYVSYEKFSMYRVNWITLHSQNLH